MLIFKHSCLTLIFLACTGCATHRTELQTWHLADSGILIPPGRTQRTFTADIATSPAHCPQHSDVIAGVIDVAPHNKYLRVTVDRIAILKQQPGWLTLWAANLEATGCLAPGEAPKLATLIAESLPLEPNAAFRLLYAGDRRTGRLDLSPDVQLQVTSPILKPNASSNSSQQISGDGNTLTLTASSDLLGYEIAFYRLHPKLTPMFTERHIGDKVERASAPLTEYFHFAPDSAFYRLLYKSDQTDFTALVIAAPTVAQLDNISCQIPEPYCMPIPRRVAINAFIPVTINGHEQLVSWGATLAEAIRESGERQPADVLPRLLVRKKYHGQPTEIRFNGAAILDLPLTGGEAISWR